MVVAKSDYLHSMPTVVLMFSLRCLSFDLLPSLNLHT